MRRLVVLAVSFCLLLSACSGFEEPDFPESAIPFAPPPEYRVWWEVLEGCSGHRARFDDIRWFKAPFGDIRPDGKLAYGVWFARSNRIAVISNWESNALVRHEMLHAILQDGSHPDEFFKQRCGDLVLCGRDCPRAEAPPNAVPVSLGDLELELEVFPRVPSLARYDGAVSFVLKVRNTTGHNAYIDIRSWRTSQCDAGVVVLSEKDQSRSALLCDYVGLGGLPAYFHGNETRSILLDMRLQHLSGQGPFFAEPLIIGGVLGNNVRHTRRITVLP